MNWHRNAATIHTVLFDNDGTLIELALVCRDATNAALAVYGLSAVSLERIAFGMRLETAL